MVCCSLFDCIFPSRRKPTAEVYPLPELSSVSESSKIYPISKYAYSFQRRLRELATPKEAYNIQLADIDQTVNFNPTINHVKNYTYRMVYNQNLNDLYVLNLTNNETKKVNNLTLYNVESIYLYNFDSSVFDHALFQQTLNSLYVLHIVNSTIDSTFMARFSQYYTALDHQYIISLESCQITVPNIFKEISKLGLTATTFKNCLNFNWIDPLSLIKKTLTYRISFVGIIDDIFWNVDAKSFEKLFINQQKYNTFYQLHIFCEPVDSITWLEIRERILELFNDNFVECNNAIMRHDVAIHTSGERRCFIHRKSKKSD